MTVAAEPAPELTHAMREYLQAALRAIGSRETTTITELAERVGVTPASTTAMVKKLAGMGLVTHEHYGDVGLTEEGRRQALLAVRRHRLIECFLVRILKLGLDEVHEESDRLEPAISDRLERKIDEALGHPTRCPHGDPIPDPDGAERVLDMGFPLSELEEGAGATVVRVPGHKPDLLRYLVELGIEPERELRLVRREPFGGPLHLKSGRKTILLGPEAAAAVHVTRARS